MEGFTTCLCYTKGLIVIGSRVLFWWIIPSKIFTEQEELQGWWSITILLAGLRRSDLALSSEFSHWGLGGWNWLLGPWPRWQGDKQSWREASGATQKTPPSPSSGSSVLVSCWTKFLHIVNQAQMSECVQGKLVYTSKGADFNHFSDSNYTILQKLFLNAWGILPE